MSKDPDALKAVSPYSYALYDFCVEEEILYNITKDFQELEVFFSKADDLVRYLSNPLISNDNKQEILEKILKSSIHEESLKFLFVLIKRNRINLLKTAIYSFLEVVYRLASIKMIRVTSAIDFTAQQKNMLVKKIKKLTKNSEIRLMITVDPTLIGGFSLKTSSKVMDFTIKHRLQKLANHLDGVLILET